MSTAIGVSLPRLSTAVGKAVSEYAVLGKTPGFTADFIKNKYPGKANFASAITHSRSGNAVMTDGYGPELLDNGSFTTDVSSWSIQGTGVTASSLNGVATVVTNSSGQGIYQNITTEAGKTYIINWSLVDTSLSSANVTVRAYPSGDFSGSFESTEATNGYLSFTATGTDSRVYLRTNGADVTKWDSVSVREMPVLKWAPHNIVTHSGDLSQATWVLSGAGREIVSGASPVGTDAYKIVGNTANTEHKFYQTLPSTYTHSMTVAVFAKADGYNFLGFRNQTNSVWDTTFFNLSTGQVGTVPSNVTASMEDVGNGWYLCKAVYPLGLSFNRVQLNSVETDGAYSFTADGTSGTLVWGAHAYRSDLGGMAGNPDQPPSRASYVPTTSTAVYLPRIGHHVYNGSAWVNEGLLAESEARTNLFHYSHDFSNSYWGKTQLTVTADQGVAPDGTNTAFKLIESSTSNIARHVTRGGGTLANSTQYTAAVYLKKGTRTKAKINVFTGTASHTGKYDIENGTVYSSAGADAATIEDVGNGWFRCSITTTTSASGTPNVAFGPLPDSYDVIYDGDGSSYIYAWGATLEASPTRSSYIPTTGAATVTRAAETFTIPSANLPWPSPNYIGSQLVTNGTFDTNSDWTLPTGFSISSGVMSYDGTGTSFIYAVQTVSTTSGKVYAINFDTLAVGGSVAFGVYNDTNLLKIIGTTGSTTVFFVASASTTNIIFKVQYAPTQTFTIDNVSVREINPLSVSIAMDGRMTFADTNDANEALLYRWHIDFDNRLQSFLSTAGTRTGQMNFFQEENNVQDSVATGNDYYATGILTPFDIASRHGSTFVNGATEGVALTADTTPTALADLSSTDMTIAHVYMGTIGTFRVWDRDITNAGLVEATNPSLEPSLSLTFEGTGTNSFVVNDWSE